MIALIIWTVAPTVPTDRIGHPAQSKQGSAKANATVTETAFVDNYLSCDKDRSLCIRWGLYCSPSAARATTRPLFLHTNTCGDFIGSFWRKIWSFSTSSASLSHYRSDLLTLDKYITLVLVIWPSPVVEILHFLLHHIYLTTVVSLLVIFDFWWLFRKYK